MMATRESLRLTYGRWKIHENALRAPMDVVFKGRRGSAGRTRIGWMYWSPVQTDEGEYVRIYYCKIDKVQGDFAPEYYDCITKLKAAIDKAQPQILDAFYEVYQHQQTPDLPLLEERQ